MVTVYGNVAQEIQINIKVCIKMIKNVVMVFSPGQVAMFTKAIILMICGMVMEKCIGVMEVVTKVIGRREFSMDKV